MVVGCKFHALSNDVLHIVDELIQLDLAAFILRDFVNNLTPLIVIYDESWARSKGLLQVFCANHILTLGKHIEDLLEVLLLHDNVAVERCLHELREVDLTITAFVDRPEDVRDICLVNLELVDDF